MMRIGMVSCAAMVTLALAGVEPARSQTNDHMKCYRVSDRGGAVAVVDLETAQFGLDAGCKLKARSRELCMPAAADVIGAEHVDPSVTGENLTNERLCYRIRCPKRSLPQVQVADRFGTRAVALGQARRFCTSVTPDTGAP
jgi:hypothetical protein